MLTEAELKRAREDINRIGTLIRNGSMAVDGYVLASVKQDLKELVDDIDAHRDTLLRGANRIPWQSVGEEEEYREEITAAASTLQQEATAVLDDSDDDPDVQAASKAVRTLRDCADGQLEDLSFR